MVSLRARGLGGWSVPQLLNWRLHLLNLLTELCDIVVGFALSLYYLSWLSWFSLLITMIVIGTNIAAEETSARTVRQDVSALLLPVGGWWLMLTAGRRDSTKPPAAAACSVAGRRGCGVQAAARCRTLTPLTSPPQRIAGALQACGRRQALGLRFVRRIRAAAGRALASQAGPAERHRRPSHGVQSRACVSCVHANVCCAGGGARVGGPDGGADADGRGLRRQCRRLHLHAQLCLRGAAPHPGEWKEGRGCAGVCEARGGRGCTRPRICTPLVLPLILESRRGVG